MIDWLVDWLIACGKVVARQVARQVALQVAISLAVDASVAPPPPPTRPLAAPFAQVDVQLTCCAALARIAETASRVPTLLHTTLCDAVLGAMRRASSPEAAEALWSETNRDSTRPEGAQVCALSPEVCAIACVAVNAGGARTHAQPYQPNQPYQPYQP